ncbi:MAG TPA: enoyl-CoA hydratase-related protein, partial [Dehalococcoidia bacterium]|nr:enoyl-CoA hydratase-related protein [Dehalococcoidia bacterium]
MAETYEFLRVDRAPDGIVTVTFDRPPVNAMSQQAMLEITACFRSFADEKETRVVILTAAGERAFMAGVDLADRPQAPPPPSRMLDSGTVARECFWAVYDCAAPVIGAINGPALGAGLAVASMCDVIIASERAKFALPEIDVGLLGGGTHLFRLVGSQYQLRRMMYTGIRVDAKDMARFGCIEAVVPPDELLPTARALAQDIAK